MPKSISSLTLYIKKDDIHVLGKKTMKRSVQGSTRPCMDYSVPMIPLYVHENTVDALNKTIREMEDTINQLKQSS